MPFKKDTKEKFTVYTFNFTHLTANMAEECKHLIHDQAAADMPPHVVLNLSMLENADQEAVDMLLDLQHQAYEKNKSFVICGVSKNLQPLFQDNLNLVPTESEAWDIVQMEEIERELLGDQDNEH